MNTKAVIISMIVLVVIIFGSVFYFSRSQNNSTVASPSYSGPQDVNREIVQYPINPNSSPDVSASKLPSFTFDISGSKYKNILTATKDKIKELVSASIVRKVDAASDIVVDVQADSSGKKLTATPEQLANFKPGSYKLSLTLRTLEGEINIEQNFTWGVIAVNTNKSVYKPGEKAKIAMGVLTDAGETLCATGINSVKDLELTVINPQREKQHFSLSNNTIRGSKECGPITVTNIPDFEAEYQTGQNGLYTIVVTAINDNGERQVSDYFKVDSSVNFDVERNSFPTRIYPKSPYANTFTITSKRDYSGEVSDILPAFFDIFNISEGGTKKAEGDFVRVKWKVNLKANVPHTFSYFVNFPPISPEFYLIGPIKVGDFTEARQWQIASDVINSTSGVVSYEDNGGSNLWSRIWTGSAWNPLPPAAATAMSTSVADGRWFRVVSSPKTGEKIVAIIDNTGSNDQLHIFTWNGTNWGGGTPSWSATLSSTTADVTRSFDISYEELSGDVLVVYSNYSSNQLLYRHKVAGAAWPGVSSNAGSAFDVYKRWVRLEPQFNSDAILVGYLNNNERVGAMIWDGSTNTFGDQFSDAAGTLTATSDEQAFDIAWETNSGTPMVFWGTTGNNLVMREFTGGVWQAESTVASGFANDLDWVMAAADPVSTSNNISLGLQDGATCVLRLGVWTGAAATMNGTTQTCPLVTTNNLIDTAFENDTGKAVWAYVRSATSTQISWDSWTSGGEFTGNVNLAGTYGSIEGINLTADLNTTSMMLLFHDGNANCQLWHLEWDGSGWSSKTANAVHANICAAADNDTLPYGFGFDRNLETMAGYRWFANSVDLGASLGTLSSTQDTPYTLTQQNQQFRLRLLLYYPDALLTSAGRQYKLQYVDPGTGTCADPTGGTPSTWTDVPTSGGSTISFYDNPGLNDGDNIATSSADPSYQTYTRDYQDYEERNNFTNSRTNMSGDRVALWDFSLIDNTGYDRVAQTFCFRVARSNDLVLRIVSYPQISTAAIDDVLIQGGTQIDGATNINNL